MSRQLGGFTVIVAGIFGILLGLFAPSFVWWVARCSDVAWGGFAVIIGVRELNQ